MLGEKQADVHILFLTAWLKWGIIELVYPDTLEVFVLNRPISKRMIVLMTVVLLCALSLAVFPSAAFAAAGSSADPLVTRSYLENKYLQALTDAIFGRATVTENSNSASAEQIRSIAEQAEEKLELDALAQLAVDRLWERAGSVSLTATPVNHFRQMTLHTGDILTAQPGCVVRVQSGRVQTRNTSKATFVDLSKAQERALQWELTAGTYLLVTETAPLGFTPVLGDAQLLISGEFTVSRGDGYAPSYTDLADALNKMGLFRGTGKGYELDRVSRRDEGLVMMLRLLGEEQNALKLTKRTHPFGDVAAWVDPYVSYAYQNKLINGTSKSEYSSAMLIEPEQYVTFLLRALGYTDSGDQPDFHYQTAMETAVSLGIFSQNEADMLTSTPLYRDKMAYISYYGLFAQMKNGTQTLLDALVEKGAVDYTTAQLAIFTVTRTRP